MILCFSWFRLSCSLCFFVFPWFFLSCCFFLAWCFSVQRVRSNHTAVVPSPSEHMTPPCSDVSTRLIKHKAERSVTTFPIRTELSQTAVKIFAHWVRFFRPKFRHSLKKNNNLMLRQSYLHTDSETFVRHYFFQNRFDSLWFSHPLKLLF